jgi:hypothetical protein
LKDVKVNGKDKEVKEVRASDIVNDIMIAWDNMVESLSKESYADVVVHFRDVCKKFPKFHNYVETTILNTIKENFVRAWTDGVLHLGCRTTNSVEVVYGKLKKYLSNSVGDLATCWNAIDKYRRSS